jgi:capsid portal protein
MTEAEKEEIAIHDLEAEITLDLIEKEVSQETDHEAEKETETINEVLHLIHNMLTILTIVLILLSQRQRLLKRNGNLC